MISKKLIYIRNRLKRLSQLDIYTVSLHCVIQKLIPHIKIWKIIIVISILMSVFIIYETKRTSKYHHYHLFINWDDHRL